MTPYRYEDVMPDAALFLALVRGRQLAPGIPSLDQAVAAARARELPRAELASAIDAHLRTLGAPPQAITAAERLGVPGTVCVVAGQQPVLLGGAHFVVTKALAAVALARRIEAAGMPCVPVFWVASEDNDHAEVDHVDVGIGPGAPERLVVPLPRDRRMLSRVAMPPQITQVVARLAELLPDGPGREEALALVRPESGDTVGTAFARILLGLCGRFGLVLIEPRVVRPFARAVIDHELEHAGDLAGAIAAAEEEFATAGFARPLSLRPRQCLFFIVDRDGRRHAAGSLPAPGDTAALAAWQRRLADKPEGTSWNVAARVLAQNTALPVAAQISGPSEYGYCAALGAAHGRLGIPAPALVARPGITFAEHDSAAHEASQERSRSILPYLARYGMGLVDRMLEVVAQPSVEHCVVPLGGVDVR